MSSLPAQDALRVIGVSHHTAPVGLRERLAFRADDLPKALAAVLSRGFHEAVILSTCNRVEIYAVGASPEPAARLREFLSEYQGVGSAEFGTALYEHQGVEAILHIFEVAASLDSQILGETEILGQSREAYRRAAECGACGRLLRSVFERAFFLAKELRCDGGIGRAQASVSAAAVALAKKVFELKNRKILVVGTGEMASGIVRALKAAGAADIWVASRTESRAAEFAQREGGTPCRMQQLEEHLTKVDIVLVSTDAPHFLIGPKEINAAATKRRGRTLCLIDISVPRNVDPAVHELEDTFLFDIDDLEDRAQEGRLEREAFAARCRPRLAEEARELLCALSDAAPADTARKLMEHADARREEIFREYARGLDPKAAEALGRALERLQGKMLHGPLDTLRQAAREGGEGDASAWITRLFRLQHPAPPAAPEAKSPAPASAEPAPSSSEESGVIGTALPRERPEGGGEVAIAAH